MDSLSLFREGVKPEWEDPLNAAGGEVLFRSDKLELVNQMWYELVLAVVGQVIPMSEGGEILGVRVLDKCSKSKIEYRVEVWYSEDVDAVVLMEQLQTLLKGLHKNLSFSVRNHSSTLQKTASAKGKGKPAQSSRVTKLPAPAEANTMRLVHVG